MDPLNEEDEVVEEEEEILVQIFINGNEHRYRADYDTLHSNDWNIIIRDMLDDAQSGLSKKFSQQI